MTIIKHKKLIIAAALGTSLFVGFGVQIPALSSAASNSVSIQVAVKQSTVTNDIDWSQGADSVVIAEGRGRSGGRGESMARLAAITDAQRNLLGIIKNVQIDSDTLMRDLMIESDVVQRKISGLLRGAQIFEEYPLDNDEYCVKMYVPLYGPLGSLASVIVPEIMDRNATPEPFLNYDPNSLTSSEINSIRNAGYTGVIINADGLGMDPTFSPVIYDTEGRAIYGVDNLEYDTVIEKGMVDYANDLNGARADGRAGNNPLVIDAVEVRGGQNSTNKVNAVVSVEDANKILLANESTDMLEDTSVVFVK